MNCASAALVATLVLAGSAQAQGTDQTTSNRGPPVENRLGAQSTQPGAQPPGVVIVAPPRGEILVAPPPGAPVVVEPAPVIIERR